MLSERRKRVLSALVKEYVHSAHPVASGCLVQRYELGCSPATVRNDLVWLEESGHVFQPHVSAGRIPTDGGYRVFVEGIAERGAPEGLSAQESRAVAERLRRIDGDAEDVVREAASLLARLTNHVAVVVAPMKRHGRVRRLSLVSLGQRTVLLVVVTDAGDVADRHVELPFEATADEVADLESFLSEALGGRRPEEVSALRAELMRAPTTFRQSAAVLAGEIAACLVETDAERFHHGGAPGLLDEPEFAHAREVRPLLSMLEEGLSLLGMLTEAAAAGDVVIRIGHENGVPALDRMSVVAAGYGGADTQGVVCLIGPTRMDYGRAVGTVRTATDTLTELLD